MTQTAHQILSLAGNCLEIALAILGLSVIVGAGFACGLHLYKTLTNISFNQTTINFLPSSNMKGQTDDPTD